MLTAQQADLFFSVTADLHSPDPARHRAAILRLLDYRGFPPDSLVVLNVIMATEIEIARCRRGVLDVLARAHDDALALDRARMN